MDIRDRLINFLFVNYPALLEYGDEVIDGLTQFITWLVMDAIAIQKDMDAQVLCREIDDAVTEALSMRFESIQRPSHQ